MSQLPGNYSSDEIKRIQSEYRKRAVSYLSALALVISIPIALGIGIYMAGTRWKIIFSILLVLYFIAVWWALALRSAFGSGQSFGDDIKQAIDAINGKLPEQITNPQPITGKKLP